MNCTINQSRWTLHNRKYIKHNAIQSRMSIRNNCARNIEVELNWKLEYIIHGYMLAGKYERIPFSTHR